jgi:hypothetical protein
MHLIATWHGIGEDLSSLSEGDTPSPVSCRGSTVVVKFHGFQRFRGVSGVPEGTGRLPFVSFLHTGETVPAGSDPVSGKSGTSFCFILPDDGKTGRNHGVRQGSGIPDTGRLRGTDGA